MLPPVLLLATLAANPAQLFVEGNPASQWLLSVDGSRILHASGFLTETGATRPEDAASAFLSIHGEAFGVTGRQTLTLLSTGPVGSVSAVHLGRVIAGLPVFHGDIVVGVDEKNRVFLVNASDVPIRTRGTFVLTRAQARSAAVLSLGVGARTTGPSVVVAGWRSVGDALRAAYQVDFTGVDPAGDWRVYVDAETAEILFREDRRRYATATGNVFELSPMETLVAQCPISGSAHAACATPITPSLPNLTSSTSLTGGQVTIYNCQGANEPASVPGGCVQAATPTSGVYNYAPDATNVSTSDSFAEVMAYYHLDKHYSFLKSLDPAATGGLTYNLPAFVNVYRGGAPFNNAYFSGGTFRHMVFGQGTAADFTYDAPVAYHEMTHGAVDAWGGFNINLDALGGLDEPAAVNEGTADALAVSEFGRSQIGLYIAGTGTAGTPSLYLRDLNNMKSCKGTGTAVTQLGVSSLDGLDGEVHDDGEIWNGFFWELHSGLAGIKGCLGQCDAVPAIQYKAMEFAGGTSPTLQSYASTFVAAATALFPDRPNLATYAQCVLGRRALGACDRTFPLYASESKAALIRLRYGTYQYALQITGNTAFTICSRLGTSANLWFRGSTPVVLVNPTPTGTTTVDTSAPPTSGPLATTATCPSVDTFTITAASPATGYLLIDSVGAFIPNQEVFVVTTAGTGMATRPAPSTPATCVYAGDPMTLSSIVPAAGPIAGGTAVTLTGTNFAAGVAVTIGGSTATVTASSTTSISAVTPAHAAGSVDVVVANPDGRSASLTGAFTYRAPPTLSAIAPASGPIAGGTAVTLTGTNFAAGVTVTIGGSTAAVTASTSTSISATTPPHAAGVVDVVVTNPDSQNASLAGAFTYRAPPTLSAIAPTSGPTAGGTTVTLTGTNFASGVTVTIGGSAAAVTASASMSISATTPPHAAGVVDVVATNSDGQSATLPGAFTYNNPASSSGGCGCSHGPSSLNFVLLAALLCRRRLLRRKGAR